MYKDKFGRKQTGLTIYPNGYTVRYHNTRISCIDRGSYMEMSFARVLSGEEREAYAKPPIMQDTCTRWVRRGTIQYQKLILSKKAALLMLDGLREFKQHQQ